MQSTSLLVFNDYIVSPKVIHQPVNYGEWIASLIPTYGQEIVISCPLEGNPSTSYQWYFATLLDHNICNKNRSAIHPDSYLNITLYNNNRTLYFREFNEDHNGCYSCSAKNILGNATFLDFPPIQVSSKWL